MRRRVVGKHYRAAALRFALGFAFHQHLYPAPERGDFGLLRGDNIAQIVHGAGEVGEFFFKVLHGRGFRSGCGAMIQVCTVPANGARLAGGGLRRGYLGQTEIGIGVSVSVA